MVSRSVIVVPDGPEPGSVWPVMLPALLAVTQVNVLNAMLAVSGMLVDAPLQIAAGDTASTVGAGFTLCVIVLVDVPTQPVPGAIAVTT